MTQGEFDFDPVAHRRRNHRKTSHDAAVSMLLTASGMMARILIALRSAGPATRTEISRMTGFSDYQTSKRVSDLANKGLIRDTGKTRAGPSGREQTVWEAA
jgi:predicted transcriptional regulator